MDVLSRVGEWLNDGITVFLNSIVNGFINSFTTSLSNIYEIANRLFDSSYVSNTILLMQGIATMVLICRITTQALSIYILWNNGEPQDSKNLLFQAFSGGFMIYSSPYLCKWIFNLGSVFANDIASVLGYSFSGSSLTAILTIAGTLNITLLILAIVTVVLFLLVVFQAATRAVELCLLAIVGPVLTIKGFNADLTKTWFRNVLVLSMTQGIQIFLIKGLLVTQADFATGNDFLSIIFTIGFLWVCYRTPNILKEYTYSTGTAQGLGGMAQQAGSMYLMRRVFTKV